MIDIVQIKKLLDFFYELDDDLFIDGKSKNKLRDFFTNFLSIIFDILDLEDLSDETTCAYKKSLIIFVNRILKKFDIITIFPIFDFDDEE